MSVTRTGDWAAVTRMLTGAAGRVERGISRALRQEAHALRNEIVQGPTTQAPGGESIKPPAPLTIAARQLRNFGGTKALMVRGDLRNAISVVVEGDEAFIGVLRSARGKAGQPLVDLAKANWSQFSALVLAPGVPLTHPEPHWTVRKAQDAYSFRAESWKMLGLSLEELTAPAAPKAGRGRPRKKAKG